MIKNVLRAKGSKVETISPDATLTELVDALAEHRIGAMIVSADGAHIDGIVSERDIVRALRSDGGLPSFRESRLVHLDRVTVAEIMTSEVTTCTPETSIDEVMTVMTAGRIRHVPVVSDEELVGIVSIGDIVAARISHLEWERSALVDYVTTGR
ncbi:MAG TPA: CBS domain-containing protein [Candidatus Limnocylindrales bacterium]|nr:CBS domain-containing protein [Candidatus Limnocylindrales bacterium]